METTHNRGHVVAKRLTVRHNDLPPVVPPRPTSGKGHPLAIQSVADIPLHTDLTTDVCIVGAGPSGIALALRLQETTALNVVLLESGEKSQSDELRDLNRGQNVGLDYYDLRESRRRMLGGGSQAWAGWCRPLDDIDIEGRPWFPNMTWPITPQEMRPYYRAAAELCQLEGDDRLTPDELTLPNLYQPPFSDGNVEIAVWRGSPPTKFGTVYSDRLASARQVTTILGATATEILSSPGGRAEGVQVASLAGNSFRVMARVTVLTAGALETARLLLSSNRHNPAGLANENDLVGRHFMEHPHLVTGRLELFPKGHSNRPALPAVDRGPMGARSRLAMQRPAGAYKIAYTISRALQESEHLLNFSTHLQTINPVRREESDAYQALKLVLNNLRSPSQVLRQIRSRSLPEGTSHVFRRLVRGTPEIARILLNEGIRRPRQLALYTQCEQSPNPDSRVTIDHNDRDPLGMPRLRLDWRLTRVDKDSAARSQQIVGTHLEAAGLGRLVPEPAFQEDTLDWGPNLRGGHHHLGTARMAIDPRNGVVAPSGETHTVRDLYISDSSVFPTGGFSNPMLTNVALALRSADTIANQYDNTRK